MARNNRRTQNTTALPSQEQPQQTNTAISLRLPEDLSICARRHAEKCGVSLNGLICLALADYLMGRNVFSGK